MHSVDVDVQAGHTLAFLTSEVTICSGFPFWVRVAFCISCVSLRVMVPYSFKNTPLIFSGSPYNPTCNAPLFPQDTSGYERSSLSFTDSALAQMKGCTLLATYLRLKKMYPSTAFFNFQKALWIIQWGFVRLSHLRRHVWGALQLLRNDWRGHLLRFMKHVAECHFLLLDNAQLRKYDHCIAHSLAYTKELANRTSRRRLKLKSQGNFRCRFFLFTFCCNFRFLLSTTTCDSIQMTLGLTHPLQFQNQRTLRPSPCM